MVTQTSRFVNTYEFNIQIFPQSYFNISLIKLSNVTVIEEKDVTLDSSVLLVEHSEIKPEHIIYYITQSPKYGLIKNLKLDNLADLAKQNGQMLSFSQKEVNQGNIVYQNLLFNSDLYAQCWDSFIFDVGNEVITLEKQTFVIEIIPKLITILTTNVSVEEGNLVTLTEQNLCISHPYYAQLVQEFIVVEEPKYGNIFLKASVGMQISAKSFTLDQLKDGKISYKQDSSEVDRDWFTVVARSDSLDKESLPATIHIIIQSVNDNAPRIVNNTELFIWANSSAQITNLHLAAEDCDTSGEDIMYTTYQGVNGYLINSETNTTTHSFSQNDIDSGRIYFVHVGSGNASFRFYVTDGKNSGLTNVFNIRERQRQMRIVTNEKLYVVPGMIQSITKRHLQVQSNDYNVNSKREFIYQIMKAPSYGKIMFEGSKNNGEIVSHFTQNQIDQNLVLYKQSISISDPLVIDRIVVNVHSEGLPSIEGLHFIIEIAVQGLKNSIATNMNHLVHIVPLTVEEGKFSPIGYREINLTRLMHATQSINELCFKIVRSPMHGIILKSGTIVHVEECIALGAFNNGSVVYMHDHSNTFNDSIQFNVMLINGVTISILNLTVPVQIVPGDNIAHR